MVLKNWSMGVRFPCHRWSLDAIVVIKEREQKKVTTGSCHHNCLLQNSYKQWQTPSRHFQQKQLLVLPSPLELIEFYYLSEGWMLITHKPSVPVFWFLSTISCLRQNLFPKEDQCVLQLLFGRWKTKINFNMRQVILFFLSQPFSCSTCFPQANQIQHDALFREYGLH